ncbi:tyrosine-type recombinase/integrase [Streptomyces sp. NBC_01003]|uniref:tyrosine-type recombinase/integrase n=1 Tax=Streptomyces sp. NBC_01003 TaxID=2903714 RepID=UPI00386D794B
MVLDRLHRLSDEAGVPRITVHDLRHLAATITITAGVPLTVVSKTLRHSTLSTTANLYSRTRSRRPHPRPSRDHRSFNRPTDVAATIRRPQSQPPRGPPTTAQPRPARLQHHGQPAPPRACHHTATTTPPRKHKRPPS